MINKKSSRLQKICAKISDAFSGLISAYRGVASVVFDNVYIGTSPNMPDSKWRVKRIHTQHDGQVQWYDEKAEINSVYYKQGGGFSEDPLADFIKNNPESLFVKPVFDSVFSGFNYLIDSANNSVILTPLDVAYNHPSNQYYYFDTSYQNSSSTPAGTCVPINGWASTYNTGGYYGYGYCLIKRPSLGDQITSQILRTVNSKYDPSVEKPKEVKLIAGVATQIADKAKNGDSASQMLVDVAMQGFIRSESDINPAHIIHECLTNKIWGIGVAESNIDDASFRHAADILYVEQMGMSIKWTDSTSINEFVDNIKEHINAQLYLDRVTNKWKLYLIRDDYDVADLISLDESNIRNLDFERRTLAECVNSVTVTYWDRERAKDSTVTVQDIARIAQQGGVVSQAIEYTGFTNSNLASRVALRDLKTLSSALASISFDVDESFSESWHEGMPFKLSDESYGLSEAVMRIRTIKRGDGINNTVYVEAIEDSFSSPMQSVVEYVPPVLGGDSTAKNATVIAFEVPYVELVEQYGQDEVDAKLANYPDLGYVGMAAMRPNNQHINANLYVNSGAGYDERSTLDFCPGATLKTAIGYMDSSFELQNVAEFELLEANHRIQIDSEIMAFVGFNAATNTITVKRGCFDTVPQKHAASSKIFGWDNYSGIDDIEYLSGEVISLKALTMTSSDALELSEATTKTVNVFARAIRPYSPANVKINSEYYPEEIETDLILNWVDRNRLQETGGAPLGFFDGAITAEANTLYQLVLIERDENNIELRSQNLSIVAVNTFTFATSAMHVNTRTIQIFLRSLRDGYESYQSFEHIVSIKNA